LHFSRGRVEDGRGGSGHSASPRFPSPLIERSVRISRTTLSDWLHLAAIGVNLAQSHATDRRSIEHCQKQLPSRRTVFARQRSQLVLKGGVIKVCLDEVDVLAMSFLVPGDERPHQSANLVQLRWGLRYLDGYWHLVFMARVGKLTNI